MLGAFAKLTKGTLNFVRCVCRSVRPSVCLCDRPHGTARLPLNGFSFKEFLTVCRENLMLVKI